MVKEVLQQHSFPHAFEVVSLSFFHKYEGHSKIHREDIINRHVDENGCLHTTRILHCAAGLPRVLKRLITCNCLYVMEYSVVDPANRQLKVSTRNLNLKTRVEAGSKSLYTASKEDPNTTNYQLQFRVTAKVGGMVGRYLENWLAPRLAGNAETGQRRLIQGCERLKELYRKPFEKVLLAARTRQAATT